MALVEPEELASPTTTTGLHLLGGAASLSSCLVWDWPQKQWHEAAACFEDFIALSNLRTGADEAFAVNHDEVDTMFKERRWYGLAADMHHH